MTTKEVGFEVVNDGLGYCIEGGLTADSFKDKKLTELWADAEKSIKKVNDYLKEKLGPDYRCGEFEEN